MSVPWSHLIRFKAQEDGLIYLGQVDSQVVPDVGVAVFTGRAVSVIVVSGTDFDGKVTDVVRTVQEGSCNQSGQTEPC